MFSSNYADDNVFSLNGIELEHIGNYQPDKSRTFLGLHMDENIYLGSSYLNGQM